MFKLFTRTLKSNKAFSAINIGGLAVGLSTCLLIMLYIVDEYSYDKHHEFGDRIFRVVSVSGKNYDAWAAAPAPMSAALKAELPEVEESARLLTFPDIKKLLFTYKEGSTVKSFFETDGYYTDDAFFKICSYHFVQGNPATALTTPSSIVISTELATKYFGQQQPLNKIISVRTPFGDFNYTVTAVFDNSNTPSHIPSNFFLSMQNNDMGGWVNKISNWATTNIFFTYIKLKQGVDKPVFENKLNAFFSEHAAADLKAAGFTKKLSLQPVKHIYLTSAIGNEIGSNGNIQYLYILASIAGFILLIACINFMNLSTARSEQKAREVGVRKVLGAARHKLAFRFLGESFLMCTMALLFAMIISALLLPFFNQAINKQLTLFGAPDVPLLIAALALITGLLAGLYPSLYLSAFKPASVLKGKILKSFSAIAIRKGLVVFQFTISICLILGASIIWKQMQHLQQQQLGFNKEQKIVFPMRFSNTEQTFSLLKEQLLQHPDIKSVTNGSTYPGIPNINDMLFYAEGKTVNETVDVHMATIGYEYMQTLGMQVLHGRTFSKEFTADSNAIVLNETAVKQFGYEPASAVGRNINFMFENVHYTMNIVGVMKDFNFESLHKNIQPFGFATRFFANNYTYVIANVATNDYASLLTDLKQVWQKVQADVPFEYSFIDQDFQRNYEKEQRTSRLVVYFTCIAIVIACLGLFGLAAFSAEQRTKEIGIRKVLGASVSNVAALLSKDFLKLVFIAIVIASPISWYMMSRWLQDFAYQTEISWWLFPLAGVMAIAIALATISFQSVKAALANPVKSLKSE